MRDQSLVALNIDISFHFSQIHLPGQWFILHIPVSVPFPVQALPLCAVTGLSHALDLLRVPPPHVAVQSDQLSQTPHPPSNANQ